MNGFMLSSVLSDITGDSGIRILAKIAGDGSLNASDIRREMQGSLKHTPEEIECAINGVMKQTSRVFKAAA